LVRAIASAHLLGLLRPRAMPPPQHERRRRAFATPAVYPCEEIAPAPLLASLVALASDVAGRGADAAAFPALRRAAGEVVRIAGLVLAFLEAAEEEVPVAGDAVVLGLSEIHVALQELRFLLADLGRKGARLWVLMNAEHVASELHVALRSVATAVDVLTPHDAWDDETQELAALISEQAWRAAVMRQPEPEDDRAARSVRSALERFAAGAAPHAEDTWLALRRVGITTWSGCVEEAAFLEAELLDRLDTLLGDGDNENDLGLISGLMAFTVYCRVVLFDRIDDTKQAAAPAAARQTCKVDWINQESLQCPITLELMTDPVTVATGQTYDRASIKKWMKSGCRTCPITGEHLRSTELVPNLAVQRIVEQLLHTKGVSLHEPSSSKHHRCAIDKTALPFGAAAAGGARLAVSFLVAKLSRGAAEEQRKATYEARKLMKRNVFYRSCLVDADAVSWLLYLLASPDAVAQDNAVAGLLNLSKHPSGQRALVKAGGVGLVVHAVNVAAKVEARHNAAAVLFYLSSSAYRDEISHVPEAVPTLVRLARDGAYRGRKNALVGLHGLLRCASTHGRAVNAGAVPVLAGLLSSSPCDGDDLTVHAVVLLARLAEQPVGARAVLASSALVARLVDFLGEAAESRSAREHCVALLASLGRHGGDKVLTLLGKLSGLMPALYAVIADGSPQAGKKARWLVNEIHRNYEQQQQALAGAPTAGDRVIHV
jgi:hypothetical protein